MWWTLAVLAVVAVAAGLYWAASALWVKLISDRWNAMCRDEDKRP